MIRLMSRVEDIIGLECILWSKIMVFGREQLFGCDIKSVSCDIPAGFTNKLGSFNVSLVCDPDVPREFSNVSSLLNIPVDFFIGSLNVFGQIRSVDEILIGAGDTGIINLNIRELGINSLSLPSGKTFALSIDDLLIQHEGEISSNKRGFELLQHEALTVENVFQFNNKVGDASINETIRLEVAGLPKTDVPKLLMPGLGSIFRSLGSSLDEINGLALTLEVITSPPFRELDRYHPNFLLELTNTVVNNPQTGTSEERERYITIVRAAIPLQPSRRTISERSRFTGPDQISVQYNDKGIATSYVYNKNPSAIDRRINDLEDTWGARADEEQLRNPRRDEIINDFVRNASEFVPVDIDTAVTFDTDNKLTRDKLMEELIDTLGQLEIDRMSWDLQKPTGGLGVIVGPSAGGPFYEVRRLNNVDIDSETFSRFGPGMFLSEWPRVRNLAEPEDSPGLLAPGTRVTISIFKERESSFGVPVMEQSPQTFAPPLPEA